METIIKGGCAVKITSYLDLRNVPAENRARLIKDRLRDLGLDDEFNVLLDQRDTEEIKEVHSLLEEEGVSHQPKTTPDGIYIVEVRRKGNNH